MTTSTAGVNRNGMSLTTLIPSFTRFLKAQNYSTNTIDSYRESIRQFDDFRSRKGITDIVASINKEHVEMWMVELLDTRSPSTASNRFRGLQQFWRWVADEGEVRRSPMENMRSPRIPEKLVAVLTEDELDALANSCKGTSFSARRDSALILMFISTGARKSEIANLRIDNGPGETSDIDLDNERAVIRGKGNRERVVNLTPKTVNALDRYLRARSNHRASEEPWLWLGTRGRLKADGCARAVQRRADESGIKGVFLHKLRHSFAHYWMLDGGGDDALMRHLGWKTREMLGLYAASAGAERALAANRMFGLGARY